MMIYSNYWAQFLSLLPKEPTLIATVVSIQNGLYGLELLGGGVLFATAQQPFLIGDKVFVKSGVIQGAAPALPEITIEV